MNFKSASFYLLSVSLLAQSPNVFAAKKSALDQIKELQTSLIKNKNSIDNLLMTRAHIIPKEIDAVISGPGVGDYSRKGTLASAIRSVSISALDTQQTREDLFQSSGSMADLLKNYNMSSEDAKSESTNPKEKVYSLTVLNPQHLEVLAAAKAEIIRATKEDDRLTQVLYKYIDLSIKAKRYVTFKEAETLTTQIAKMNSDLQQLDELTVELPLKDQPVVANFKKSMDEWLNKKLVFNTIAKKGFSIQSSNDYTAGIYQFNTLDAVLLKKDYSAANVAKLLRAQIIRSMALSDYNKIGFRAKNPNPGFFDREESLYMITPADANDLQLTVAADLKTGSISTKKYNVGVTFYYNSSNKFTYSVNGKQFYDRDVRLENTGYSNTAEIRILATQIIGSEISMKDIYKDYGFDSFGKDVGKADLIINK